MDIFNKKKKHNKRNNEKLNDEISVQKKNIKDFLMMLKCILCSENQTNKKCKEKKNFLILLALFCY